MPGKFLDGLTKIVNTTENILNQSADGVDNFFVNI